MPEDQAVLDLVKDILGTAAARRERLGRPYVTLTYAQSLDGSIALRPGRPLALSCPESSALTHGLRAAHDAILVGIGTVLADDPQLTVRLAQGPDPQPVVMDSRLRTPLYVHLMADRRSPWIFAGQGAERSRQEALERAGARVFRVPSNRAGMVDLPALLEKLGDLGVNSLMVEGGAQIIASFLASRLVDQMVLTIAPILVGGLRVMDHFGGAVNGFPRLGRLSYQRLGDDLVLRGEPDWKD